MLRILLFFSALMFTGNTFAIAASQQTARATSSPTDQQLRALYEAYWKWQMEEGGFIHDGERWAAGDRLPRVDATTQMRRLAKKREALKKLNQIPMDRLSPEELINAAIFRTIIEIDIADGEFREWEMPLNSDSSFWSYLDSTTGFRTVQEYRRYIARMRDLPRYFDEHIINMREGLARGFSVPRVTLKGRDASIEAYATADPEQSPFFAAFTKMPENIPVGKQAELREEAQSVIRDQVAPAYTRLLTFFRNEYLPKARKTLAAEALPNGKAYYAAQIKEYTTLNLSAAEIHEIGLKEVARIDADMKRTIGETGFKGSFAEFLQFLRSDPQFYAKTPEELLGFSSYVAKRVDDKLKDYFSLLPRYRFGLRPVPDAIAPFYTAGRGSLEACYMNTYNLPVRPLYNIPALTLHECAPGHSFQAALALEQPERPDFRKKVYFSGYGEGWGLYTEWLGISMGIYRTPYEEFGRQTYEMWRAARLVIDTGIHSMGWTREQAIEYLASHTALSHHEVETEVDRYISWPGQALAYKLGELTIRRLRADAEEKLGEKFDQRYFHDAILNLGAVPLPVLEQHMREFIASGGKNPSQECNC